MPFSEFNGIKMQNSWTQSIVCHRDILFSIFVVAVTVVAVTVVLFAMRSACCTCACAECANLIGDFMETTCRSPPVLHAYLERYQAACYTLLSTVVNAKTKRKTGHKASISAAWLSRAYESLIVVVVALIFVVLCQPHCVMWHTRWGFNHFGNGISHAVKCAHESSNEKWHEKRCTPPQACCMHTQL